MALKTQSTPYNNIFCQILSGALQTLDYFALQALYIERQRERFSE